MVCNAIYASPGIPDVPEFDIPSEEEAREAAEESASSSSPLDLREEYRRAAAEYGEVELIPRGDIENVRELLKEGKASGGDLIKQFKRATKRADRLANNAIDRLGEVFTPDNLLIGGVAAYIGLNAGSVALDGVTTGLVKGVDYIIQKLNEDVEKINYEIFYKELTNLQNTMADMDKISEMVKQSKKFLKMKDKIAPVLGERVTDEEKEQFIEKVTCDKSLSLFEKSKMRKELRDIIEKVETDDTFSSRMCMSLSQLDEAKSKLDQISRVLSINFDDMSKYRLRTVEATAEKSFKAWSKRAEKNNPYIDKLRADGLSCLSDSEAIKGTLLEKISKTEFAINASEDGGKFNFVKAWNKLFADHDGPSERRFQRNMKQDEFENIIRKKLSGIRCGNGVRGLNKCIMSATSSKIVFRNDSHALNSVLAVSAKLNRGEKLTYDENSVWLAVRSELEDDDMEFFSNPFGNMVFSTGPQSLISSTTPIKSESSFLSRSIPRTARVGGISKADMIKISDLNQLSCNYSFIKRKDQCRLFLKGMKQVIKKGCKSKFPSGSLFYKASKELDKEREKRRKEINVSIVKEKNRLRKMENFIDLLTSPSDESVNEQLRKLADDYDKYVQEGHCQKRY